MSWIRRLSETLEGHPVAVDVAITAILTLLSLSGVVAAQTPTEREPGHVLLMLMQTVPLVLRRRYPLVVLAVTASALIVDLLVYPLSTKSLGPLVAIFTVASELERRWSLVALAIFVAAYAGALLMSPEPSFKAPAVVFNNAAIIVVSWFLGDSARLRRLLARTAADRDRLLERERSEERMKAVRDERERIARELHDVVTHHVALIAIQASAASESLGDGSPQEAQSAISVIRRGARQALADMRRMLGVLGSGEPDAFPSPRLSHLSSLVAEMKEAGLDCGLAVHGSERALDDGLELSAYRVVQEALTNALRHASGSHTEVTVTYAGDSLTIEVIDDGGRRTEWLEPPHEGRGLAGMRQRVALFDGRFECGPRPDGGFRVWARLPLTGALGGSP